MRICEYKTQYMQTLELQMPLPPPPQSEVFPLYAMKAYRGSRSLAPLILNLRTGWN